MPLGRRYVGTGLLLDSIHGPVLELDGGGSWIPEVDWTARRMLGRRVTVEGSRSGFNRLDVHKIAPDTRARSS